MGIYKQFSDDNGVSQINEIPSDVLAPMHEWSSAKAWRLHTHAPGSFLDWHPSSGNLIITVLSGEIEIITSDGKSLICKAGDMRMTSDTGKGHIGRVTGKEICRVLMVDRG